jgi:hypothetical protein
MDFIDYVSKPMNKEDVILMYKINNVIPERSGLYLDFSETLFDLIVSTYLGDNIMNEKTVKEHFDWCWSKTINIFKKEKILFENQELYDYFFILFQETFYNEKDKSEVNFLLNFWRDIFNYSRVKTNSELESFLELYKIFDKSLVNLLDF